MLLLEAGQYIYIYMCVCVFVCIDIYLFIYLHKFENFTCSSMLSFCICQGEKHSLGGLGGTCVLRGCVPKKLLIYGSEVPGQAL